ncbi:MAG: hypothetical protein ACRCTA_05790, partial [Bacilli bacterium]
KLSKYSYELDYGFYKREAKERIKWIMDYFNGHAKLLSKKTVIPDRPDRDNVVSALARIEIYSSFIISFGVGKTSFSYYISFKDRPSRKNIETGISGVLIFDTYEEFRYLMFNPTYDNIHIMLDKLDEFINHLLVEKEKHQDYSYYKIGMLKVCEINGWDPEGRIDE